MWNIRLFNTFNMRERWAAPHCGFECPEALAGAARQDLDPPIRQVRCPTPNAQPIGAPLGEPPEPDPLHAPRHDPADGTLVPVAARGPRPAARAAAGRAAHEDAARRLAFQT